MDRVNFDNPAVLHVITLNTLVERCSLGTGDWGLGTGTGDWGSLEGIRGNGEWEEF
jgi:hypothetical protein